jgi:CRISPR/Cas system-associated exonuclease Cas4 (RecB family)
MIPIELIRGKIYLIRGKKVLMDSDLAGLYGVTTANLNKAVKRNIERFPDDFMFQLSTTEMANLRFQFGISSSGHGGRRTPPYAFTEQGVAMLSSVLNSDRAVQVNIAIMRAFVQMRELASSNREIARKLDELEEKYDKHDKQFMVVFDTIRQLMASPEEPKKRKIGFAVKEKRSVYGAGRKREV